MDIVAQAAAGLQAAHLAGLVHRDIKPGNLLIGPGGIVKITDFGISHAAGSAPITSAGTLVGTPGYLAPERVSGAPATPASDLYSLGIVAYECLAGAPPFTGLGVEVALAHRDRPVPALPETVPADVTELVTELTAKDPSERPGDAGEVARRARRLRDQLAVGPGTGRPDRPDGHAAGPDVPDGPAARTAGPPGSAAGRAGRPAAATAAGRRTLSLTSPPASRRGRRRPGRAAVLAAAAAAALAGLLALVLTSVIGPAAAKFPASVPSGTSGPASPTARLIAVNGSSLTGLPVSAAVRRLHRLGLTVRVRWRASGLQPAGTVLSARPGGRVPPGSVIVLTGALAPAGHRGAGHGHGHPHGQGNGHGHGKGNGKGNGNKGR